MGPFSDLDRFTLAELEQMHADTYQRAIAHFEAVDRFLGVMAGLPYPSPAHADAQASERAAMAAGTEAHELLRAIGREMRSRQPTDDIYHG